MSRLLALSILVLPFGFLHADEAPRPINPDPFWKGSVEDENLLAGRPTVITNAKDFAALWKSWKISDKVPEVDFAKSVVVLATSRGSTLDLNVTLDSEGNLNAFGFGTKDLRPGFRFVIGVVSREGVKTVNGSKLPTP